MKNIMVIQSSVTDLPTSLSDEVVGEEYNGNPNRDLSSKETHAAIKTHFDLVKEECGVA